MYIIFFIVLLVNFYIAFYLRSIRKTEFGLQVVSYDYEKIVLPEDPQKNNFSFNTNKQKIIIKTKKDFFAYFALVSFALSVFLFFVFLINSLLFGEYEGGFFVVHLLAIIFFASLAYVSWNSNSIIERMYVFYIVFFPGMIAFFMFILFLYGVFLRLESLFI